MALNVKICGIKSISHVDACVKGKAKMIGLMFYNKSPRYINLKTAKISSIFFFVSGHLQNFPKISLLLIMSSAIGHMPI